MVSIFNTLNSNQLRKYYYRTFQLTGVVWIMKNRRNPYKLYVYKIIELYFHDYGSFTYCNIKFDIN